MISQFAVYTGLDRLTRARPSVDGSFDSETEALRPGKASRHFLELPTWAQSMVGCLSASAAVANQMLWKIDFRFALDSGRSSKQPVDPLCAPTADVAMSVHRSAVSTTDQRFGSRCSGWRLIEKRHEPHRWPALDSADGGSALCPEEESVSRALVRRTLLPVPC